MDRGAWQATVQGVAKSLTRLNDCHFTLSAKETWGKMPPCVSGLCTACRRQ